MADMRGTTNNSGHATPQPQNSEAEASLLGALLIDSDAIVKIADSIDDRDFFEVKHQRIYEAVRQLYEYHEAIDVLTLANRLKNNGYLEMVGGAGYLTELTNFVPTAAHVEQYADIVAQKALRRRLIAASQDIVGLGYDESKQLKELIEEAETRLFEVSQQHVKQTVISLEEILAASFDRLDDLHKDKQKIRGIPSGYRDLDAMLAGFQRSDLVILAARPSMGKTAFVLNIAHKVAVGAQEPVLLFSLEMSKEQLVDRLLSMESGVDAWALRTGNLTDADFEKIGHAMGTLSEAPIFIDDSPGITVSDLRTKARREAHRRPLGLIIVDYLQLMSGGGRYASEGNRVQEISEISRGLKGVARELNVPVIALSQLSRSVESRNPQIPQLADLRESGCLTGDTLIYLTETGSYVPIKDLVGKTEIQICALNDSSYTLQPASIARAFSTGKKQVYRITTATGRTIRATANHKFLTISGWKRLDELTSGNHLAVPRMLPSSSIVHATMTNAEAGLLGHLIGDGCTLPRHTIQYTTHEYDLAERVIALANQVFGDKLSPRINPERTLYQVCLCSRARLTHGVRNPIASWLTELGVFGLRSYEKYVPQALFQQPNETIAVFLRHLWATDGSTIRLGGGQYPAIYYASSSERLVRDVQSLCLRLGINARISRHSQGARGRNQFHVVISGHESLTQFASLVGAVGERKSAQLSRITEYLSSVIANPDRDIIPKEVWQSCVMPALAGAGLRASGLQAKLQISYCGRTLNKNNLTRKRAALVAELTNSQNLATLSRNDIYWDHIVKIIPDGVEEVFDISVPGQHNFVAANIIVHNSIEQDADVVAFLYREDYYNPESDRKNIMDVLIKKHRNGPTGGVELYFDRDKQSIKSIDGQHSDPFGE
jgi:replicative DNA helicase